MKDLWPLQLFKNINYLLEASDLQKNEKAVKTEFARSFQLHSLPTSQIFIYLFEQGESEGDNTGYVQAGRQGM